MVHLSIDGKLNNKSNNLIEDINRARVLIANSKEVDDISHFKTNQKIYDFIKSLDLPGVCYSSDLQVLIINQKPVFVDNDLPDVIKVYKYEEGHKPEPISITEFMPMPKPEPMPIAKNFTPVPLEVGRGQVIRKFHRAKFHRLFT